MSPAFTLLLWVVDLGGLAFGVARLRRRESTWRRDLGILVAIGAVLGISGGMAALVVGRGVFGIVRLWCHVLFCVLAPLCIFRGALLLRRSPLGILLLLLGLAMDLTYLYARRVEPFDLQVRRHVIEAPGIAQPVRVAILADLQTDEIGAFEREVLARLDEERADLIFFPGDFLHARDAAAHERERKKLVELLNGLAHRPPLGAFAVVGNMDPSPDLLAGTKVRMLVDESVRLDGVKLQIVGLSLHASAPPLSRAALDEIARYPGFTIVMGHRPDFAADLVRHGGQEPLLCVAGHTHGGQIVIPGFGPLLTLTNLPRRFAGGMHRLGEAWLLVSRGVGMERGLAPRIRLFCPPELVVVDLLRVPGTR